VRQVVALCAAASQCSIRALPPPVTPNPCNRSMHNGDQLIALCLFIPPTYRGCNGCIHMVPLPHVPEVDWCPRGRVGGVPGARAHNRQRGAEALALLSAGRALILPKLRVRER
jgi:hypothetical protein